MEESTTSPQHFESWRVLTIDDDPGVHETYEAILGQERSAGDSDDILELINMLDNTTFKETFEIDRAVSGEEGLEKVRQALKEDSPYAVILLDMRMPPGWDGLQTAEMIRTVDLEVRIVLITAYMDHDLGSMMFRVENPLIPQPLWYADKGVLADG